MCEDTSFCCLGSCGFLVAELCLAVLQASRSGSFVDMCCDDDRQAWASIVLRRQLREQQGLCGSLFERTVHFIVVASFVAVHAG